MKDSPYLVALLVDLVGSRRSDRSRLHDVLLAAIDETNRRVQSADLLRVTVSDEMQGLYRTMGDAIRASHILRNLTFGSADLRFGIGGGEVSIIDAERGIQDGSAWWLAREAIDAVETLATQPGYTSARTGIRDSRPEASPLTEATARLVDSSLARLREGSRRSLIGLLDGLDNATVAEREKISASANSQRVTSGELRVLAEAMQALHQLP